MNTKLLSVQRQLAVALAAILLVASTAGAVEVLPRGDAPVKAAPEMIEQLLLTPQLSRKLPAQLRKEYLAQDIFRVATGNPERIPNGCAQSSGSLCYDYRTGRALYKPMRKLLPGIPGMTPHNLSIHRDKVVAQYTFK